MQRICWHCWSQATNQRSCQWQNPGCLQKIQILNATICSSLSSVVQVEESSGWSNHVTPQKNHWDFAAHLCHLFSVKMCTDVPQDLSRIHFNMVHKETRNQLYEHVSCLHIQWDCTTTAYAGFSGNSWQFALAKSTKCHSISGVSWGNVDVVSPKWCPIGVIWKMIYKLWLFHIGQPPSHQKKSAKNAMQKVLRLVLVPGRAQRSDVFQLELLHPLERSRRASAAEGGWTATFFWAMVIET